MGAYAVPRGSPLVVRFNAYVDRRGPDECWPWRGTKRKDAEYGVFNLGREHGGTVTAARAAWFIEHGELPPRDREVCHSCDNPPCVNPRHLWLGTGAENMNDSAKKRRRGLRPRRFDWDLARQLLSQGQSTRKVGLAVGVSHTSILNLLKRAA